MGKERWSQTTLTSPNSPSRKARWELGNELVECLLHKHERDMNPRVPFLATTSSARHNIACDPRAGELETAHPRDNWWARLAESVRSRFKRDGVSENMVELDQGRHSVSTLAYTHTQAHTLFKPMKKDSDRSTWEGGYEKPVSQGAILNLGNKREKISIYL